MKVFAKYISVCAGLFIFHALAAQLPRLNQQIEINWQMQQQNYQLMQTQGYRPPEIPPFDPEQSHQYIIAQNQSHKAEGLNKFVKEQYSVPVKKASPSRFRFADNNSPDYKANINRFINAYNTLNRMLLSDTGINIKRAVYEVENTFMKDQVSYDQYLKLIQNKINLVKYILKKEKIDKNDPDAIHYAIQKLFSDTISIKSSDGTIKKIKPFRYDFNDPFGENEPTKPLVIKLLVSGTGQCHSLPLLYMILCEEFGVKSYLAYSPQHSFIKFQTKNGTWYNFETTTGRLTSDAFILGWGFIKSEALKSNIFNAPNSPKEVVANFFIDLANLYQQRFGYDDFQQKCADKTLKYSPDFIYAKVILSNYQTALTDLALARENYPDPKTLTDYPLINEMMTKRNAMYDDLDALGFTTMPVEAYKEWLNTLKNEEEKQNSNDLKIKFVEQVKK